METPESIEEAVRRTTALSGVPERVSDTSVLQAVALMVPPQKEEPPIAGKRRVAS